MAKILPVCLLFLAVAVWFEWDNLSHPPAAVYVPGEPAQSLLPGAPSFEVKGHRVTPLAQYDIRARVIRTERYWNDRASVLAPIDFCVGWGPMSDGKILERMSFSQGQRFCTYRPEDNAFPIPADEINSHSANMHMMPATPEIGKKLKSVRRGDVITAQGYLVSVEGADGWKWRSSLTRNDKGSGACEVMWVTALSIMGAE